MSSLIHHYHHCSFKFIILLAFLSFKSLIVDFFTLKETCCLALFHITCVFMLEFMHLTQSFWFEVLIIYILLVGVFIVFMQGW
jgi:hypothetical protein